MPYGNHDIAFTLGRTQPPHQAHFNMLMAALCSLKKEGKLIQFIGSSNVPLTFAKNEKNFLSFDERATLLTDGLIAELHERYEQDPVSIPPKFAARIQQGMPVLEPEDFVCIPLPDFSDDHRLMSDDVENVRANAIAQVTRAGIPENAEFSNIMKRIIARHAAMKGLSIPSYSPAYSGWAVNLNNLLNEIVETYRTASRVKHPKVRYQCCAKDTGTLQYILLIATVIEFFDHDYDFDLAFIPIEMVDAYMSVNATAIREAYVDILSQSTAEEIQDFIKHPDVLAERYPVLAHMRPGARIAMLKALAKL